MLVEFCISSLVIICFVKSFYELADRFFGPAVLAGVRSVASRPLASHSKHFGEGARSGNAGTVATLHLARNQAGGAKSEAFRHRHHAAFRRARARSPPALSRLALDARIGERWC